jgi:transposase
MTTKEIAEAVGKTERSVRNWVSKVAEKSSAMTEKSSASTSTHPADYTLDETCEIIAAGMGANAAGIFRANAERSNVPAAGTDLDQAFKAAVAGIYQMIQQHDQRISAVEGAQKQRAALLPAPEKTPRAELSQLVRSYANTRGMEYRSAWTMLHQEIYYRLRINVPTRAKNEGIKPIDYLDREGMLDVACSIMAELLES